MEQDKNAERKLAYKKNLHLWSLHNTYFNLFCKCILEWFTQQVSEMQGTENT